MQVFRCILVLVFCLQLSGNAAAAVSGAVSLTAEEKAFLDNHGAIVFVSQTHYPPFEFRHLDGSRDGMTIELVHWLATEVGFKARFIDMSFYDAQQAVQSGLADVLTSFFYSEQRDQTFDFTSTLFEVPASIFVAADRPDIVQMKDLDGKRIAMQRGDYAYGFLQQAGIRFELVETSSFAEATNAIIDGRADAVIGDEQIVLYYLFSNNLTERVKKVGDPLYVGRNSMAVKEGNRTLLSILDKGLEHARSTGVVDRLSSKWIGEQYPATSNLWALAWPYVLAAGVVILLFFAWSIRLRQVVEEKTRELSVGEARYRTLYEELKLREERLNFALKSAKCGLWDWDVVANRFYYDPNYYLMAGYEPDAFAPTYEEWLNRLHPDDVLAAETAFDACYSGRSPVYISEFRFLKADGSWMWVLDKGEVVAYDDAGAPLRYIGLHIDISEQKQAEVQRQELEAQLRQKYKVEAIGLMAGGMAHNFNNNLAIILGSVELAQRRIEKEHKLSPLLENIKIAALRSRDLVQQVLVYSRKGVINRDQVRPAGLVEDTVKLLSLTIPATVRMSSHIADGCRETCISGDANQIQDALINLCNNAVHAMGERGELAIALDCVRLQQRDLPARGTLAAGDFVRVMVTDTGSGMTEDMQDKIFDPFFTTKNLHEGTGMGLATVQGIMDQHGGFIKVDSALEAGTTFALYFPVAEARDEQKSQAEAEEIGGDEKILFVDDDPLIVQVTNNILSHAGYRVTTATSGSDALQLILENPHGFDLLITDQTMPDMTGQELIERIIQDNPGLPIILCTGYSNRIDSDVAASLGIGAFLLKPLETRQLLQSVRNVLNRTGKPVK